MLLLAASGLLLGLLLSLASAGHAQSREHRVTNLQDAGPGSLRQTIAEAEAGDRIRFGVAGTLLLESSLVVDKDLEIDGDGQVTLSGQAKTGILELNGGQLRLVGLGFVDGNRREGGAILQLGGRLTLEGCRLERNRADYDGGAVRVDRPRDGKRPSTIIRQSILIDNSAKHYGGAVQSSSPLLVEDSRFHRNHSDSGGGALAAYDDFEMQRSIVTGNEAKRGGSALSLGVDEPAQWIVNSLIAENIVSQAPASASAAAIQSSGVLRIIHSTVANNSVNGTAGGAAIAGFRGNYQASHIRLLNSLIVNNLPINCEGRIVDDGGNLQFPGDRCGEAIAQADPELRAVRDTAGDLIALLPAESGPAVDAAPGGPCLGAPVLAIDARGLPRPVANAPGQPRACDIGAFELGPEATATPGYRAANTPTPEPADLVPSVWGWGYANPGNCADFGPLQVRIGVYNFGLSTAAPFWLEVGGERFRAPALPAGGNWGVTTGLGFYADHFIVDPENEVRERLKDNNVDRYGLGPFALVASNDTSARKALTPGFFDRDPIDNSIAAADHSRPQPIPESIPQRTEPPRCTHTPTPPGSPSQTPTPTATRQPAGWSLPDPFFDDIIWTKACPTGQRLIQPCLAWRGPQPVGAVRVGSEPPGLVWDIDLAAGPACGEPKAAPAGLTALLIDPDRRMNERSEDNNRRAVPPPDFWMPSLCTPTPTVSPTNTLPPVVTSTRTPRATNTPGGSPSPTWTEVPAHTATPPGSRLWLPLLPNGTGLEALPEYRNGFRQPRSAGAVPTKRLRSRSAP
jgi:hypothetical protein